MAKDMIIKNMTNSLGAFLLAALLFTVFPMATVAGPSTGDADEVGVVSTEIDTLKIRLTPDFVDKEVRRSQGKGMELSAMASAHLESQAPDGSWDDIDYADTSRSSWSPADHLGRLRTMAAAYRYTLDSAISKKDKKPKKEKKLKSSKLKKKIQMELDLLRAGILNGLDYWYMVSPTSDNWWWADIGGPLHLGPVGLIMESTLSPSQLASIVQDMPKAPSMTGGNRTDISKGVVYGGLLLADSNRVASGLQGIQEAIVITNGEGIQADSSFHQHGPQLHNGSYGKVFFGTAVYWAYLVRDLQWAFSQEKTDILSAYFLDGDRWMTRAGTIDYSTAGRSISRPGSSNPSNGGLLAQADYIAALTPSRSEEVDAYKAHLEGGVSGLNGHKHFWRSDYAVNMRDDYLFSVRMSSNRVEATETGNGENLLGYWLGFGNTFLMLRGDEYRNIFPVWDWKYIPGVTSPAFEGEAARWGAIVHPSRFVGGVSNGKYGVTVMDLDAMDTRAKKAWFSFENEVVALGAGITSSNELDITTTVNQSLLKGAVTVDGLVYESGETDLSYATWVHHDNVGYVFPKYWYGSMSNQAQTGSWNRINSNYSDEPISKDVFLLKIAHGLQPENDSYEYILVPGVTAEETQAYSDASPVTVLENSSVIQAVRHENLNQVGIVFHEAGSLEVTPGVTVSVDKPSALLIDQSQMDPVISVSTPGTAGGSIKVCMQYEGGEVMVDSIPMPAAPEELGKTVTKVFSGEPGDCDPAPTSTRLLPTDDAFVRSGQYADQNYGKSSYMVVDGNTGSDYKRKSFLQWDLSAIGANNVSKAEVRLHVNNVASVPMEVNVHKTGDKWSESFITWNNRPESGWLFTTPVVNTSGEWISFDVTDFVKAELAKDSVMSMVLEPGTEGIRLGLASKERADLEPELVITH